MKIRDQFLRALGLGPRRPRERRNAGQPANGEERAVRLLFAVDALAPCGAARGLLALLERLDRKHFSPTVAVRTEGGGLAAQLARLDVGVVPLGQAFEAARDPAIDLLCTWGLVPPPESLASLDLPWLHVARESLAWLDRDASRAVARALREADAVVATSPVVAECARRRFGVPQARLQLLPSGVSVSAVNGGLARNEAREALGIAPEATVFLSNGDFHPSTGHRLAIEATRKLTSQEAHPELICAGYPTDADCLESCQKAASGHGLPVRFVTFDGEDSLRRIHAAADVFVQPLGSDGVRSESLEALASGLPLVLPDTVDARELLAEKPFAVLFHDLADWSKAGSAAFAKLAVDPASVGGPLAGGMRAALRGAAAWPQAAESGREIVEQSHGADAVARCFEGVFASLIRRRP
jgi:glycosyltransferase involved in cell wall biosynthesis